MLRCCSIFRCLNCVALQSWHGFFVLHCLTVNDIFLLHSTRCLTVNNTFFPHTTACLTVNNTFKKCTNEKWRVYRKNIHPPRGCIFFIYTLHFSLMHSQTVLGVLHAKCILSVFFDLRCESVTYMYNHSCEKLLERT